MKHVKDIQLVRPQWREGPLAGWLDAFADWVNAQGYAPRMAHGKVPLAARFSQWLEQEEIGIADINPDHAARYLEHRTRRPRSRQNDTASLRQFTDFLRRESVLSFEDAPADPMTDAERCEQAYELHLRQTRGLAPSSIATYLPFVRNFLRHRFASGSVTLSSLSADDVVRFVQNKAPDMSPKCAKCMATALRSFLRYACHLGEAGPELVAAVPVVAGRSMPQIPRGGSPDQVSRLLAGIDCGSATGRRDHAVNMLLARLGLRASEIGLLEPDDIDWRRDPASVLRDEGDELEGGSRDQDEDRALDAGPGPLLVQAEARVDVPKTRQTADLCERGIDEQDTLMGRIRERAPWRREDGFGRQHRRRPGHHAARSAATWAVFGRRAPMLCSLRNESSVALANARSQDVNA